MTRSASARASASESPSSRSAPWCTCTRRSGSEPRRLALPVADQRHRAHQQRGAAPVRPGRAGRDERQQLDGLAQAHVVGQDAAEAELAEEGQPGQPALLVRAQLAGEAGRGRHRPQPVVGLTGQQVAQPAVGVHPDQRDLLIGLSGSVQSQAHPGRQRVRRGHRPGLVALQELQRRLQVRVVQLDPLAAQPDQRHLQPGQLGQLVRVERLVAHCHVVPEVHQVTQAEPGHGRPGGRRAGRGAGPRGQLQPEPGLAHPVRQQHAEPGAGQQRPGLLEEPERARRVHLHQGGSRLAQRVVELAEEPGGRTQAGQQLLHRIAVRRRARPRGRPRRRRRRPSGSGRRRIAARTRPARDRPRGWRARRAGSRCAPGRPGSRRRPARRRVRRPARPLPPRPPASPRRRGHRPWSGPARTVRPAEGAPGCGRAGRAAGGRSAGPARRRRPGRPGRCRAASPGPARRRPGRTGAWPRPGHGRAARRHRRAPAATAPYIHPHPLGLEHGQHPAACGQAGRETRHRGQVGQRPAGDRGVVRPARNRPSGLTEQRERGGGAEGEHGHPPARQRHPAAPGRNRSRRSARRTPGAPGASGRTSSGEASGPPPADGSCRVSSSWTALRTASPAAVLADRPTRPAGRPARRPGRRTDAAAAGARRTARPRAAAAGPGPRPTGRARRAPRPRGLPA